ncbi:response regulator [Neorhizobium lilium]|uniref:Response regulator n=1 Tax=Neorhizobium lilium TaxID=2503024 RepID=A0A444LKZ1_9HYPH|nr:response regulator [Neorhizobium lilium]RWX81006.1 response regulator [Neorhizobium lilium]
MKQVLIIDDAATVRMYHRQILEEAGFGVDEAINGIEAIEKILSKKYELLVVDVNMPKMNGYAFLQEIRSKAEVYQAPAIMVSTEAEERDRQAALQAGANFYLVKPTKPGELSSAARLLTGSAS